MQRAIHTPEWWEQEMAAANAMVAPYMDLEPDELTPEVAMDLFSALIREIGQVALITRTLALERPAPPPEKRERPKPRRVNLDVKPNLARKTVTFMGVRFTPEQALVVGERLIAAVDQVTGRVSLEVDAPDAPQTLHMALPEAAPEADHGGNDQTA